MRNRHTIRSGLAALVAVSLAWLATACGSQVSGLDGTRFAGTSSGTANTPGSPLDFSGSLANHSGQVVILKSAQLLPVKGFRLRDLPTRRPIQGLTS